MHAALKGRAAFNYAFNTFSDTVYRVALHNSLNTHDAEDAVQDVFIKLIENDMSFKDAGHLKAWLIRATINRCRDIMRKEKRFAELDESIPAPEAPGNEIIELVKNLPVNYRNAIYLHYYEGYTAAEIGKILDAKTNTVLSWLARGREMLKAETGDFDDE